MNSKLIGVVFAFITLSLFGATALAAERVTPFTQQAFKAAQTANEPILIDIWASWCPTCKQQGKVLHEVLKNEMFDDLVILRVDYDKQKEFVRQFKAPRQSTLIVFRGTTETGRAVAITADTEIETLLLSAYPSP